MGKSGPTAIPITTKAHAQKKQQTKSCPSCTTKVGKEICDCDND